MNAPQYKYLNTLFIIFLWNENIELVQNIILTYFNDTFTGVICTFGTVVCRVTFCISYYFNMDNVTTMQWKYFEIYMRADTQL